MSSKLTVAMLQANLIWENPHANRAAFKQKICQLPAAVDLVVLPEMFTTGFTMSPERNAEVMNGITVNWMQELAQKQDIAIVGSLVIKDNTTNTLQENQYFNRLLFIHPNRQIDFYNKKHLFTLAGEHHAYTAGKERMLVNFKGWKICPLICYDLRFPVWARNTVNYDLLLYVANWPAPRINAWNALLKARAIENMSFTLGVNRVGIDCNNYKYTGNSTCFDTLGNCLTESSSIETVFLVTLDKEQQYYFRKKFNFLADRDNFEL